MKRTTKILVAGMMLAGLALGSAHGATLVLSDNFDVVGSGTGFNLDTGVNRGITATSTRLQGTAAAGIRYNKIEGGRNGSLHWITNSAAGQPPGKLFINYGGAPSTIALTNIAGGLTDFGPALFATAATPDVPSVYHLQMTMANIGTNRFGFGISSAPGIPNNWDFGFEIYRDDESTQNLSMQARMNQNSAGVGANVSSFVTNDVGLAGEEITFLIRMTDAGAETGTYNSRGEIAIIRNGTTNWIYDTQLDTANVPYGLRFRNTPRYLLLYVPGGAGPVTADDLSLTWISGPTRLPLVQTWTGSGADDNWSTAANWSSGPLAAGDPLVFGAPVRQLNNNDISSLTTPSVSFTTGGFELGGNELKIFRAITNSGNNTLALPVSWSATGAKTWNLGGGTMTLAGPVAVDVGGDQSFLGGGTLLISNSFNVGSASTANPAFLIGDCRFVLNGSSAQFSSRGGFRIGSSYPTTPAATELVMSNGASFYLSLPGAACRVGSTANGVTSRVIIDNSTFTMTGGEFGVPWAAGATGEVIQAGSSVLDPQLLFNYGNGGSGTYRIKDGLLEPRIIKRNSSGGFAGIYFDNAILRPSISAGSDFMTELDVAEIQSGGLTLDVVYVDVNLAAPFSGAGTLTKSGGYAATLTGRNTYTGNTVVQAGKLVLPNTQTNAAAIQVADGAQFGAIATAQGASLTAGSLSIAGTSGTLAFDLGTLPNPTAPLAQVGTLSAGGTITVNVTGGALDMTTGTFTLLKWNSLSGSPTFVQGTIPSHIAATVVADSDSVDLVVTGVQGYRWTGNAGSEWFAGTENWIDLFNNTAAFYQDGYLAEFRDGAATGLVNINSTAMPSSVAVNNSSLAYTFENGAINTPLLKKQGTGSLTRTDGSLDQIGQIELNEGSYVANATVDADFALPLTDTSAGLGTFVKDGAGILSMTTNNSTFDGTVLIQGGTLRLTTNAVSALGSTNGVTIITNGASLDVFDRQSPHEPVIVSGEGVGGQGAIVNNGSSAAVQNNLTDVIMAGDTTFGCVTNSRWDIRIRSSTGVGPGLRGNGFNLTKVGPGWLSISSQRHDYGAGVEVPYWHMNLGDIYVKEGIIAFEESTSLDNPEKRLVLFPGSRMNLFSLGVTNPILRNITATNASITSGGSGHTNIINGDILMDGVIEVHVNGSYYFFNGNMSGNASLILGTFGAPGYIFLNGANTFTGDTTVTNSTLAGNGSLAGNLIFTQSGKLSPGDGVGTFTVGGNVTLAATTITTMELNPGQAQNCDQLSVGGALTAGGTLDVVLASGASAPTAPEEFALFNKGVSFTTITALPAVGAGLQWDTSTLATDGKIRVVSSAPPSIGTVSLTGGVFTFSGTGGTSGGTYYIVTSLDISAPMSTWTPVETNTFATGGTFTFSMNIVGGAPQAFFRLVVP